MSVFKRILAVAVSAVVVFGMFGCADQTQDANQIISEMNTLIGQSNALGSNVTRLIDGVNEIDPTTKNVSKATTMLAEVSVLLEQDKVNVAKVVTLADELAALDVSEDIKTYAGQQKEIAQLVQQGQTNTAAMVDTMQRLYDPKKGPEYSQAELDALAAELTGFIEKDNEIRSQIVAKSGVSQEFFTSNLQ